jgi:hypothetical protein
VYINRQILSEITGVARRHWSHRRAWTWAGFVVAFAFIRGVLWAARKVDDFWWPEIANQKVEQPVFICSSPRSGSTLLHRLMDLDEERFASLKLYQSMFCAVSLRRLVDALERADRRIPGRPLHRCVDGINAIFFRGWEGIHEMGIDKAEEDEGLFALCLESPSVALLMPWLEELPSTWWFDDAPAKERDRFLDDYEDALRRHLFASGGSRALLNKNALFAPRLRSIFARFPDARFIYPIRHPYEALPSFLNMFHDKWSVHSPEIAKDSPEARALARLAIGYLRYALDCRKFIPSDQLIVVRYDDLVADPGATVERIYAQLKIPMDDAFAARLREASRDQRIFVSEHRYSLEEFGLSKEAVFAELKDVFAEFGFEK